MQGGSLGDRLDGLKVGGGSAPDGRGTGQIGAHGHHQLAVDGDVRAVHEGDSLGDAGTVHLPGPPQRHRRVMPGIAETFEHSTEPGGARDGLVDLDRLRKPAVDGDLQAGQDPAVAGVDALRAGTAQLPRSRRQHHPGSRECGDEIVKVRHRSTL